jgi:hypothetical protein
MRSRIQSIPIEHLTRNGINVTPSPRSCDRPRTSQGRVVVALFIQDAKFAWYKKGESVSNKSLACLFPEARGETRMRRSPQGSKASNQPVWDTSLVDALDALPSVLKVPSSDTWKVVLREGLNWTDETREGSPHLNAWGTHPRGSSTQERDRGRMSEI